MTGEGAVGLAPTHRKDLAGRQRLWGDLDLEGVEATPAPTHSLDFRKTDSRWLLEMMGIIFGLRLLKKRSFQSQGL